MAKQYYCGNSTQFELPVNYPERSILSADTICNTVRCFKTTFTLINKNIIIGKFKW